MEKVLDPELQAKEKLRSRQRESLVAPLSPKTKEFLTYFIPSGEKTNPFGEGFNHNLRRLTSEFGQNTYVLLFGLAATAKSPHELNNIFTTLASLGNINWDQNRSIKTFVRSLVNPPHIPVSQETHKIATQLLDIKDEKLIVHVLFDDGILDFSKKRPYLLETFFDILTSPKVSKSRKEKMLQHLNEVSAIFLHNAQKNIFDEDASFWRKVDISWLFSDQRDIKRTEEFDDDPFPALKKENEDLRELLAQATQKQQALEGEVKSKESEIAGLKQDVATANSTIEDLKRQLVQHSPEGSKKLTVDEAYKLLGLEDNHDPKLALKVIAELSMSLHSDPLRPELERRGRKPEIIEPTLRAAARLLTQVNNAKDKINES